MASILGTLNGSLAQPWGRVLVQLHRTHQLNVVPVRVRKGCNPAPSQLIRLPDDRGLRLADPLVLGLDGWGFEIQDDSRGLFGLSLHLRVLAYGQEATAHLPAVVSSIRPVGWSAQHFLIERSKHFGLVRAD